MNKVSLQGYGLAPHLLDLCDQRCGIIMRTRIMHRYIKTAPRQIKRHGTTKPMRRSRYQSLLLHLYSFVLGPQLQPVLPMIYPPHLGQVFGLERVLFGLLGRLGKRNLPNIAITPMAIRKSVIIFNIIIGQTLPKGRVVPTLPSPKTGPAPQAET